VGQQPTRSGHPEQAQCWRRTARRAGSSKKRESAELRAQRGYQSRWSYELLRRTSIHKFQSKPEKLRESRRRRKGGRSRIGSQSSAPLVRIACLDKRAGG